VGGFLNANMHRGALGAPSFGHAVNNAGTAVGYADERDDLGFPAGGFRALRWGPSGATVLGHLGADPTGDTRADAYAINTAGTSVGWAYKLDASGGFRGTRAVRWDGSGTAATELGNLGTSTSSTEATACAINSAGTAAGYAYKYNGSGVSLGFRAVRWDASGTAATELGTLGTDPGGSTDAKVHAINTAGTAVGYARKYDSSGADLGQRAVRWDASGTVATELGGGWAEALEINAAGTAVGNVTKIGVGVTVPVRWDASGTAATELEGLGGSARAVAINDAGTVAGNAASFLGWRAVRWDASGTAATELGILDTLPGGYYAVYAINADGIVAGFAGPDGTGTGFFDRAVVWGTGGIAIDLNTLIDPDSGWTLKYATSISDTNFVAGVGTFDPDGIGPEEKYDRLFVLNVSSAVPEPGSIGFLALGGVTLLRRRRRG